MPARWSPERGGTLDSGFVQGTSAARQNFPILNRIISGMSLGIMVMEGAECSWHPDHARCALE
jgi:DNA processing protein